MYRKLLARFLAALMIIMSLLPLFPALQVNAAGKTLIVHYGGREDNTYEGWNLWIWEEGREGKSVEFTSEDSFGKIAVYQTNRSPKSIGFIVRLNNWEEKDVAEDRYVSMDSEVVEIWVTSAQSEFVTEAPEGAESFDFASLEEERLNLYNQDGATKLNVHYYNFANDYGADKQDAFAWTNDEAGGSYPYVETDDYGAVFHVGLMPKDGVTTAGVKVIEKSLADVDMALEYEIDLTKKKGDCVDVYIVEGNSQCWYSKDEAVFMPVISKAEFREDSSAKIDVELSRELLASQFDKVSIVDDNGNSYEITSIDNATEKKLTLLMAEALPLANSYKVEIDGYVGCEVAMSKILGSEYFDQQMAYDGDDLGAVYSKESTTFKVWAPMASEVTLNLYEKGDGDNLIEAVPMQSMEKGVWSVTKQGDQNGVYYTYTVKNGNKTNEVVDLYARTTGVNGDRGMVIDLASTIPEGFENDVRPEFKNDADAVIYEIHVRDMSSDPSSGIKNAGKFLGLTEKGTKNSDGLATGLDHIVDLGVTHVQIQPSYDYATVDETKLDTPQFNWGYDPKNYNVPEGSYSTDPYNGEVRVKEMKEMIKAFHDNGIRVNMDVVYNHTYSAEQSWFQKTVPDYYYRKIGEKYSNGSGCGNETASERAMVRKYIVDSVVYWASEYHVDGFRFDLMAVHDQETMKAVREALDRIDPTIMLYGEGWTGGDTILPQGQRSLKSEIKKLEGIGAFSDDIRDGIKGNVFDSLDKGFVNGKDGLEETIKFGVVGAVSHPQVLVSKNVKGSSNWAKSPEQSINYISCHDNLTFWDKLAISNADDSEEDRVKMNKLGNAIIMTSQGVPFMLAGEEMLRSKPSASGNGGFDENSYCSPDSTNSMKWDNKSNVMDTYEYYKGLIDFRQAHSALRMTNATDVMENITFMSGLDANVVAYTISNNANGDTANKITVIYNANNAPVEIKLPQGDWDICVNADKATTASIGKANGTVTVDSISAMVLVQGDYTIVDTVAQTVTDNSEVTKTEDSVPGNNNILVIVVVVVVLLLIALAACGIIKKRNK